ncbi:MAG: tyrosine-type recombinase/integrase [Actinomycetota bacterium]|nr:tyrosine-type recombinase/integrase [Actinomycetota bacterium]
MSTASSTAPLTSALGRRPYSAGNDDQATMIMALTDKTFLVEMGWDPGRLLLCPPEGHRLVVRPVCRVEGCSTTATNGRRICFSCQRRLAVAGLADDQVELLDPPARSSRAPASCLVAGCARERVSGPAGLCGPHRDQRRSLGIGLEAFVARPDVVGHAATGACLVSACPRQRRHRSGCYCEAHQLRLRAARRDAPGLDEQRWRRSEPAVGLGGQVSLRGLEPLVVAQVLFGLAQRCLAERVQTKEADLRAVVDDLRRQQVRSIDAYVVPERRNLGFVGLANSLAAHARRALATPESEVRRDHWDLQVFGHTGTLSFAAISQPWLREVAKAWAADDLPRRRIRAGRRTSGGLAVRHHIGCVAMLSESLRLRPDRGEHPGPLGRADMEAFLNRLAYLVSTGRISADARIRATREVRAMLSRTRAMGLTRPARIAAGLGEDFAIHRSDVPDKPESANPGRDLPAEVLSQLCAHLDEIASPETRTGIELAIDTGRRPEEICDLAFDCLARDDDGLAVLVFDNHKANRLGRRLPIPEATAQVIVAQQARVAARFGATPTGELKLLPTDRRNPDGRHAITAFSLAFAHREWVARLPALHTAEGTAFDRHRVVLYAYRHSYAQRHADAGVPIDVLRELMDHRKLDTTKGYYRVGEPRRREAVERVAALAFDRHGNRVWRQARALLDSEHTRLALGEVAVPYGVCTEPSNVKAGGGACPFRFRCAGCDHFRTDISYLPDLHAYLDDLLRNRERLLAATEIDEWARTEAMPSEEEIGRVRTLIARVTAGLDDLSTEERAGIDSAVEVLRRHRAVALAMPQMRRVPVDLRPRRHP